MPVLAVYMEEMVSQVAEEMRVAPEKDVGTEKFLVVLRPSDEAVEDVDN